MKTYCYYIIEQIIHKWYVMIAGRKTKVSLWRRVAHDWSKFTPTEIAGYSNWLYGGGGAVAATEAWHHHLLHNDHHPEHWIVVWRGDSEGWEKVAQNTFVLPMPKNVVREFIADMMASSKYHTGSYDIASWLAQNHLAMGLHSETVDHIHDIMIDDLGYFLTDNCPFSFMACDDFRIWDKQTITFEK